MNATADQCPYAPRHRPMVGGHCDICGFDVPEPWYMRARPDPGNLVGSIAACWRVAMEPFVAEKIAEALLGYADHALEIRQMVIRETWDQEGFRDRIREEMRYRLLHEVITQGCIPSALPSEALRYFATPLIFPEWAGKDEPGGEIPPAMADRTDWTMVQVILAVPVRTPPVDRAAAVRAGVL